MFDEIRKSTTGALDKAKLLLNPNATTSTNTTTVNGNAAVEKMTDDSETASQQQPDRLEELSEFCPQLTYQQRLIGFVVSFSLGCKLLFTGILKRRDDGNKHLTLLRHLSVLFRSDVYSPKRFNCIFFVPFLYTFD